MFNKATLGYIVMGSASAAAAGFSVWFFGQSQDTAANQIFLSATFAISATVSPVMSMFVGKAKGLTAAMFAVTAIGFTCLDAIGGGQAWVEMEHQPALSAYRAQIAEHDATLAPIEARLSEARTARFALSPDLPACTCPQTRLTALTAYEAQVSNADALIASIEAEKAAIIAPVAPDRGDAIKPTAIALLVQILIAVSFFALGRYSRPEEPEAEAEEAVTFETQTRAHDSNVIDVMDRIKARMEAA